MPDEQEAQRRQGRWLRRLALITDETQPLRMRLSSVRAVQRMLPGSSTLRGERPDVLLDRVKPAWGTRPVRNQYGRLDIGRVKRPPVGLSDVW
jgi:hypothetical protein